MSKDRAHASFGTVPQGRAWLFNDMNRWNDMDFVKRYRPPRQKSLDKRRVISPDGRYSELWRASFRLLQVVAVVEGRHKGGSADGDLEGRTGAG